VAALELRARVAAPIECVYEVVADVERYPEFLSDVAAVERRDDVVAMTLRLGLLSARLVTRATFSPNQAIDLELVDGPFRRFSARWSFAPADDGSGTEVRYRAEYELPLLGSLLGGSTRPLFEAQARRQIAAFEGRARALLQARRGGQSTSAAADAPGSVTPPAPR
jgi:ribosome-associated toxin RatA of RatAB toxin-antitoxin module